MCRFFKDPDRKIAHQNRRTQNALIAQETKNVLPGLLAKIPGSTTDGYLYPPAEQPRLDPKYCPGLNRARVRVYDCDSFDSAIELANNPPDTGTRDQKPVLVLNLASDKNPGGGWMNGAAAQEEALCYRSSLSLTLKRRFYPLGEESVIYSPQIVIMRTGQTAGHQLMKQTEATELPVVSVISSAALRRRKLNAAGRYQNGADKLMMKRKMRSILRVAAWKHHRRLVLGALGCGALGNPKEEVAALWAEVFEEPEFSGGWWESVIFAVMKERAEAGGGKGNFQIFKSKLDGMMV